MESRNLPIVVTQFDNTIKIKNQRHLYFYIKTLTYLIEWSPGTSYD